jgi:hypothetical protein
VRERGVQARRAREADGDRRPRPPDNGLRFWQVLAVVGLIAATAGWTTAAVIAFRPSATPPVVAEASPSEEEAVPSDDASLEPPIESHQAADLEALLPANVNGTSLTRESWTGDTVLGDDNWSTSITTFLATAGKTAADLQASQAYDAAGTLDLSAGVFRATGIAGTALRDALIAADKGDYPDLKVADTTIGGLAVKTGDFGEGSVETYWYVRGDVVFDIETGDPSIAQAALAALPEPGASAAPPATAPASAGPPASSPSPS